LLNAMRDLVEPILYVSREDESEARRLFPGLPVQSFPVIQQFSASSLNGLQKLLTSYRAIRAGSFPQVDLVHSLEAYPAGLIGHWLARRLGRPHVLTAHGTYGVVWDEQLIDRQFYRQVLSQAAMVCPVSHGTLRLMQVHFGVSLRQARLRPILNGNNFWKNVPRSQAWDREPPNIPTLISVGQVKPRKGYHTCLEAFAALQASYPAARYLIIGSYIQNAYFSSLQEIIARRQIENVAFLGALPEQDLGQYYQQAALFFLAPQQEGLHFEGFGLVFLEAGAYGLPVVATRSGGVPEAVLEGVTGLLVAPGDSDGMARALLRLLEDPDLARRMGRANRDWAETHTWERAAQEQYQAYQEALQSA
jgi:glycosyltransferase involved in cell wall biosynthesis